APQAAPRHGGLHNTAAARAHVTPTVLLPRHALLEPLGMPRYSTAGWGPTSGPAPRPSRGVARTRRSKARANPASGGPGAHGWCAAPSVCPSPPRGTIWSSGGAASARNVDEPYETGSTPLRHLHPQNRRYA